VYVKDLAVGQNAPFPVSAVRDHVLAVTGRETGILERPVQETAHHCRFAGILAEKMALIARLSADRIVAIYVGRIVV